MTEKTYGIVISCIGGLYTVRNQDGENLQARARGILRHEKKSPLIGDTVSLCKDNGSYAIEDIKERKNFLIRPPVSNIDTLFISFAPVSPTPNTFCIDKLISIAEAANVNVAIVITKCDLSPENAEKYKKIYAFADLPVFVTSSADMSGTEKIKSFMENGGEGKIYAFAGASGIGKSTLVNTLYPFLSLKTGELSKKTERGKQTTRTSELFPVPGKDGKTFFVADTPGFSSLDFSSVADFKKEDLASTFREFSKFTDKCRYRDCTHTKENECGIISAVKRGDIAKSRHDSFLSIYEELSANQYKK